MIYDEPDFYSEFRCIGSSCEDTCCSGMGVVVDKPAYDKLRSCNDPILLPIISQRIVENPQSVHTSTFALVAPDGPACSFLSPERLCNIQLRLGEEYLPRTCDTYPRAFSRIDGSLQKSLYLSCPEAARLILFRTNGIRFHQLPAIDTEKYDDFPTVDTSSSIFAEKPYYHFNLVRAFALDLLKNRSYRVWERLVILGMYCDQLGRLPVDQLSANVPLLTESFAEHIEGRKVDPTLSSLATNPSLLLNVVIGSIEDRLASDYTSPRFIDCYRQFLEGVGYVAGIETSELAANYNHAYAQFYAPSMAEREYVWENFLVAKMHKDLFPFGAQKSLYPDTRSIYQAFVLLAMQYIFARTLLVGVAAKMQGDFSEMHILAMVQSFSRAVEHNRPYLDKILRSFEQGKIAELPTLASLIKE